MALSLYERKIRQNRRDLLALDTRARSELERAYVQGRQQIQWNLRAATMDVADLPYVSLADLESRSVSPGRQLRIERLTSLEQQIDAELGRLTRVSEQVIRQGQGQAARMGAQQAMGLVEAQAPGLSASFNRLPTAAVESLVGQTGAGTPLRELLSRNGQIASRNARDLLSRAVVSGTNPRDISRELGRILGRSEWQAEVVARDAMLDAHRNAALRTYQGSADLLAGWQWRAAYSSRTCLACLGLSGRIFPLKVDFFPKHPACRCSPSPVLKDEFGPLPDSESGSDWLKRQPESVQRTMLPNALYDDFAADRIILTDFVKPTYSKIWGPGYRQATIPEAQAAAAKRGGTLYALPPLPKVTPIRRSPPGEDDGLVNVGRVGL